ncbi:MAG TPA: acyl-CoA dehydrogenase family protein [Sphingobium sp.]|nr:acyl-CoA dehydrogenase family protein [Sphingobium sp.]
MEAIEHPSEILDRALLDASGDSERFRAAVRDWLGRTVPSGWRAEQAAATEEEQLRFQRWWSVEMAKVGMTSAHWPAAWGGEELPIAQQIIFYEELARADAPNMAAYVISLNQLPATLFGAGTQAQKDRYVRGVLQGDIWCQGFSEPGAGSDLAALRTRALRQADGSYLVDGQKVWTSNGHFAKYCLLLARTDPDSARHKGLSLFVMDMASPGITLRPIRQSNGQHEFNEMFLDNVVIPAENLIGAEGDGWMIAQSALSSERGLMIFEIAERLRRYLSDMARQARQGAAWWSDDQYRREFVSVFTDAEALALMIRAMLEENVEHAEIAGQSAPMFIKLFFAKLLHRATELMMRVQGLDGQNMLPDISTNGAPSGNWMHDYVTSWSWSIAGGSNEIMRNLIGERVLGLPR